MTAAARIGANTVLSAVVHVPANGPWHADIVLEQAPDLSGSATLTIGTVDLVGTIDPRYNATFGLQRRLRLVAGAGGWGRDLNPKGYHNDGNVRSRMVAEDAARGAGETLAVFSPAQDTLGRDFVRSAGVASVTLEQAASGVPWWVDYDGRTHVEQRPTSTPAASAYQVLNVDALSRVVEFVADDIGAVRIGAVLTARLDQPMTVRELEISVAAGRARVKAWCGISDTSRGRLLDLVHAIVRRAMAGRIYGVSKYRVGRMTPTPTGDRYELQPVRAGGGLPNLIPVSAWPGLAGSHSLVANGAEVLVQFIDGDPTQPVITHFAGKGGVGWIPREAIIAASEKVRFGSAIADKALALAQETKAIVDTLQSKHDGHAHGPGNTAATTGPVLAPNIVGPLGEIASTKVVTDG